MSEEITRLASISAEKKAALKVVTDEQTAALTAAKQRVITEFSERLNAAQREATAAASAYETALRTEKESKTHPWEGKKVTRKMNKRIRYNLTEVDVFGIVEVRRTGTIFAENVAWHMKPDYGQVFVRLLKADGKPGLMIEKLTDKWTLADEQVPA
jgi:hypothetical protein